MVSAMVVEENKQAEIKIINNLFYDFIRKYI